MPHKDKKVRREYMRKYMAEKRKDASFRDAEKVGIKKRSKGIIEWFDDYKSVLKCEICGEARSYCLEFHHAHGTKEREISRMVFCSYSIKTILSELKKCQVLCSNCHKELHHFERKKK
mgnify:CR=1 FL=1